MPDLLNVEGLRAGYGEAVVHRAAPRDEGGITSRSPDRHHRVFLALVRVASDRGAPIVTAP